MDVIEWFEDEDGYARPIRRRRWFPNTVYITRPLNTKG